MVIKMVRRFHGRRQKIIPVTQAKKELLEIVKEMAEEDITVR